MGRRRGAARLLLLGVGVTAPCCARAQPSSSSLCKGGALQEYNLCTVGCGIHKCAVSAFDHCDVLQDVGASDKLNLGRRSVPAKTAFRLVCETDAVCAELHASILANTDCCPRNSTSGQPGTSRKCPYGFPLTDCGRSCAPAFIYYWTHCEGIHNASSVYDHRLLARTDGFCRDTLVLEGVKQIYAQLSTVYMPKAVYIIALVPFMFCLMFVFFGRHIENIFRMFISGVVFCLPVVWPAFNPYFSACTMGLQGGHSIAGECTPVSPISATFVMQVTFGVTIFYIGAYSVRTLKHFGDFVQGFALGFVISMWLMDMSFGELNQHNAEVSWLQFTGICSLGGISGTLTVLRPAEMTMAGSAILGSFLCSQIVCLVGIFENWIVTFPVSLIAGALGVAGCQTIGCWLFLSCWVLLAIVGVGTQLWTRHNEFKVYTRKDAVGCLGSLMFHMHHALDILLDLEDSMKSCGLFHTKEEMEQLADHHAASWVQAATFTSDICILTLGVALFVDAVELIARGLFDFIMFLIVLVASMAVMLTIYEMSIHNNVTVSARIRKFNHYIWGIFIVVPLAVKGLIVCTSLGMESDPFGMHDDFVLSDLKDDLSRSDYDARLERTIYMRCMQVAAVACGGLVITCSLTAAYVSKNLGGWLFLAKKVTKLVAGLLFVYGLLVCYSGAMMVPKEQRNLDMDDGNRVYAVASFIGLSISLVGVMGIGVGYWVSKKLDEASGDIITGESEGSMAETLSPRSELKEFDAKFKDTNEKRHKYLRAYCALLLVILSGNIYVFVMAALFASRVDSMDDEEWADISGHLANLCRASQNTTACDVSRSMFVNDVMDGYNLLMALGITTSIYLAMGLISTLYVSMQSANTLDHASALVARHAQAFLDKKSASGLRDAKKAKLNATKQQQHSASALERLEEKKNMKARRQEAKAKKKKKKSVEHRPEADAERATRRARREAKRDERRQRTAARAKRARKKGKVRKIPPKDNDGFDNPLANRDGRTFETETNGESPPPPMIIHQDPVYAYMHGGTFVGSDGEEYEYHSHSDCSVSTLSDDDFSQVVVGSDGEEYEWVTDSEGEPDEL